MKKILIKPIITEKSLKQANELNQYAFMVTIEANKIEVAHAVAEKFAVKVIAVRIMNILGKNVRFGKQRIPGIRSNYKKAVVTLAPKNRIPVFDIK